MLGFDSSIGMAGFYAKTARSALLTCVSPPATQKTERNNCLRAGTPTGIQ
jgi:hypothetical protein